MEATLSFIVRLAPHTLGNSVKGEGPAPLQEFGSRTGADAWR